MKILKPQSFDIVSIEGRRPTGDRKNANVTFILKGQIVNET